jgi:hypothetical protein
LPTAGSQNRSDLRIEADLAYQHRTWRVQRIAWLAFILVIVGALAGVFGSGPLSSTSAGTPTEGLSIEYERFARLNARTTIVVRADRRFARGDEIGIVLSGDAVRAMELQSTTPPADGAGVSPDGVILRFRTDRQPGELTLVLHTNPRQAGRLSWRIGLVGGPTHSFRQWVYP